MAPLIDCHDPGRTVSREPNMHNVFFYNADQFSIGVSFNTFYNTAKSRKNSLNNNNNNNNNNNVMLCLSKNVVRFAQNVVHSYIPKKR